MDKTEFATENNMIQRAIGTRFRRIITNTPDGIPPWLPVVASGDDRGLYLPTDAPWVVHGDFATLIGGIRALLVQALHPGSLTGVTDHSRYEADPLGRLAGTTRWLTILTFAGHEAVAKESQRVNRMHDHVTGDYVDGVGERKPYRAADPDLLLWVHIAFTQSFLTTHQLYSRKPIPGGADAYIGQWAKSVIPLGLVDAPQNERELNRAIEKYVDGGLLQSSELTLRVADFIEHPPLSLTARFFYRFLFQAAAASLPIEFQRMLNLKPWPMSIVKPLTRTLMRLMTLAIGKTSPIEEAAKARLRRIGELPTQ